MKRMPWGWVFGGLVLISLLFFEMFNYSTTAYALRDLLGDVRFLGIPWATWLALAFCGIDTAGLARLFALPEEDDDATEMWFVFGAWFLAATMNALLTWWGVSVALMTHTPAGEPLLGRKMLLRGVPVFLALLVWLTRITLMGTVVQAGPQLFVWRFGRTNTKTGAMEEGASRPPVTTPKPAVPRPGEVPVRPRPRVSTPAR